MNTLSLVTLVVPDYEEGIAFFVGVLGFELVEDRLLDAAETRGKRWVVVRPVGSNGAGLLLARAATERQTERIGDQTGGRVAFFLETDDHWRDRQRLLAHGVVFDGPQRREDYGTVVVFRDPWGNRWDLIQPRT